MAQDCKPSKWGKDDQIGAANLVSPERTLMAAKLIKVLLHTGWTDGMLAKNPKAWVSGEPGLTNEGAVYLASLDVMAVGADTWGVEAVPPVKGDKVFYGHVTLQAKNGIYILETMNTGRLAKEIVHEFMFVLGQARLKGAVQMTINPVAMW